MPTNPTQTTAELFAEARRRMEAEKFDSYAVDRQGFAKQGYTHNKTIDRCLAILSAVEKGE